MAFSFTGLPDNSGASFSNKLGLLGSALGGKGGIFGMAGAQGGDQMGGLLGMLAPMLFGSGSQQEQQAPTSAAMGHQLNDDLMARLSGRPPQAPTTAPQGGFGFTGRAPWR